MAVFAAILAITLIRQKRGETEMSNQQINVIVHVSGQLGAAERAGIAQAIAAQPGVSRAQPSPNPSLSPHLTILRYFN